MINLGCPIPQQIWKQPLAIHQSGDKNNTSKNESKDSYASLSPNSNSKQSSLAEKMDQILKETSTIQKASSILTPSPSRMTILHLLMLYYKDSKSNGSIANDISGIRETLSCVCVNFPTNKTNPKSIANWNTLFEMMKSDWITSDAKTDYC